MSLSRPPLPAAGTMVRLTWRWRMSTSKSAWSWAATPPGSPPLTPPTAAPASPKSEYAFRASLGT